MSNPTTKKKPATHFSSKYTNCNYILDTELTPVPSNALLLPTSGPIHNGYTDGHTQRRGSNVNTTW